MWKNKITCRVPVKAGMQEQEQECWKGSSHKYPAVNNLVALQTELAGGGKGVLSQ